VAAKAKAKATAQHSKSKDWGSGSRQMAIVSHYCLCWWLRATERQLSLPEEHPISIPTAIQFQIQMQIQIRHPSRPHKSHSPSGRLKCVNGPLSPSRTSRVGNTNHKLPSIKIAKCQINHPGNCLWDTQLFWLLALKYANKWGPKQNSLNMNGSIFNDIINSALIW